MSSKSQLTRLGLPLLAPGQSLKHITINEALSILDTVTQLSVISQQSGPPAFPEVGDSFIVANDAIGDWVGREGEIATWQSEGWDFLVPVRGMRAYDIKSNRLLVFLTTWEDVASRLTHLGVNAKSDELNRLVVAAAAILLSHDGSDLLLKLNKSETSDSASLIFQTDHSGRVEIGTTGDDDLHIRTSSDGVDFQDALTVSGETGCVNAAHGLERAGHKVFDEDYSPGALVLRGAIPAESDLNTYRETGLYHQSSNSLAASGQNYPVAKAGLLQVVEHGKMTYQTYQVFSAGAGDASRVFVRGRFDLVWGEWRRQISEAV